MDDKVALVLSLQEQGVPVEDIFPQTGHGSKKALQNYMKRKGYTFKKGVFSTENVVLDGQVTIGVQDDGYKENVQVVTEQVVKVTKEDNSSYSCVTKEDINSYPFNEEEVAILKMLIKEHRLKDELHTSKSKGTLKNRNIRVYNEQYKEFAEFCKSVGIIQAEALHQAIENFMQQYRE